MTIDDNVGSSVVRWKRLNALSQYQVTKAEAEFAKNVITCVIAFLAIASVIAMYSGRPTSSILFSFANGCAAFFSLFISYHHVLREKPSISWRGSIFTIALFSIFIIFGVVRLFDGIVKPHIPSVLTLWATDNVHSNEVWHKDFPPEKPGVRFYYKLVQDLDAQTKFLSVYLPDSLYTAEISQSLADNLQELLQPYWYVGRDATETTPARNNLNLKSAGRIILYHEAYIDPDEEAAIRAIFKRVGIVTVQFFGSDQANLVGTGVVSGLRRQPPDYVIDRDKLPCRITPREYPGARLVGDRLLVPKGDPTEYTDIPFDGHFKACKY
jgi:hypothetical protein